MSEQQESGAEPEQQSSEQVTEQQTTEPAGGEEQDSTPHLVSSFGGHRLHPTVYQPTEPAKALVCISHGFGEHMGRYDDLGSHLTANGVLVFGHDHVGHGHSEGERVHVEDVDSYVQDVIRHVEHMKGKYPHLPCILMGHSMGGLVAGLVAIQRSDLFTALVLSGPAVERDPKLSNWFMKTVLSLIGFVAPQLGIRSIDPNDISSIPEEVQSYVDDPLVNHGSMKARWGSAILQSIELFRTNIGRLTLPLLLLHGSDDRLVPISASHFINDNAASQEKRFEVFEDNHHETLHDKDQERARDLIKDWVLAHLTAPEPAPQPNTGDTQPSQEDTQPASADTQPSQEDTQPASADTQPSQEDTQPAADDTQPSQEDTQPAADDTQPSQEDTQPAADDTQPSQEDTQPAADDTQPSQEDTQPASAPESQPETQEASVGEEQAPETGSAPQAVQSDPQPEQSAGEKE